ncbi:Cof-type HAD-IIB family hydrolase [Companilactobacillus hulinensis]|uniref:Cof-type HAD-IIB family hydrolase n=1 Tax=Companilactobacillus hulinensis TaxID=2486007 RepID=UPI000F7B76F4|nr:Cof-type HAD-IIB family hydrolase [Companilactobacillus hulinensis]
MSRLKLVAVDMDGTFLNDHGKYDTEAFREVHQLMDKKNIQFVVASGNQYYQLKSFFEDYPETIFVSENGAMIADNNKEYWSASFNREDYLKVIEITSQIPDLDMVSCGKTSAYVLSNVSDAWFKQVNNYYTHLQRIDKFENVDDEILKFASNCPDNATDGLVQELTDKLKGIGTPVSGGNGSIDIIQPGMNKAAGLSKLGKELDIKPEEMCAFGDGGNDIEMLQYVGDGVAMANAPQLVKNIADNGTGSNNEQGVISYLKNILENEG